MVFYRLVERIHSIICGKILAFRSMWLSNAFASFGDSRIAKGVTIRGGGKY